VLYELIFVTRAIALHISGHHPGVAPPAAAARSGLKRLGQGSTG
jgi:hypothetical protein